MLQKDPTKRPYASQLLKDELFSKKWEPLNKWAKPDLTVRNGIQANLVTEGSERYKTNNRSGIKDLVTSRKITGRADIPDHLSDQVMNEQNFDEYSSTPLIDPDQLNKPSSAQTPFQLNLKKINN